ncbi:MAG: multiheme c-type cytochrome [Gammaproteobacteria bacterium]|nr:multiheme c-type cytochrome [Gammaproteobacteria bacterium]
MNYQKRLIQIGLVAFALLIDGFPVADAQTGNPNTFNRLMKPPSKRNPPPARDGIHDPENVATESLQPPKEAFSALPKGKGGNYVDWVQALDEKKIGPRFDRVDADAKPIIMDLNIVREVKGSMPNVVYPHKQHTEWLDCSNCHPAIFIPQKGANQISMASILLGEKCGVCHGKVAFPVSECRRCHSQPKGQAAGSASTKATPVASQAETSKNP